MDHVRQLMLKYRPGMSIRQIEQDHGLSENQLGYYLKPGSRVLRVPTVATLNDLARALDCDPEMLFVAFSVDLGYPVREADRKALDRLLSAAHSRR